MERLRTGVAIIGGGPAGSTVGTLLKKYKPDLEVAIFEREQFPRDHVGESQLPATTWILEEMGVWEKVEEAGFPVKLGAAYRWGATDELWYLDFIEPGAYESLPRPAKLSPQRRKTAFQVDRSRYDAILLDHAEAVGCNVYRQARVRDVNQTDGFVTGLVVEPQDRATFEVKARSYVDASGEGGVLRNALGVPTECPTTLRNIAFWDYWQQAEWAERAGDSATRIQVMSLGWGWMWFIPISDVRTSVGLVLPAEHYKQLGKRPEEIYLEAVQAEPMIRELTRCANREGRFSATKDWNFLASDLAGENWFLTGDSCGFADPILSAGMTLAHTSARKVAYSILELLRRTEAPAWIRSQYSDGHRHQIRHHMRFAEFWYAGNGRFTDLKEYCSELAQSAGLELDAEEAFYWLATGGFAVDTIGVPMAATFPMSGVKLMTSRITGQAANSVLQGRNMVERQLEGVVETTFANYEGGRVRPVPCLVRGDRKLPFQGAFAILLNGIAGAIEIDALLAGCVSMMRARGASRSPSVLVEALEALVAEGWVRAWRDEAKPKSRAWEGVSSGGR
jgi:flavin-dependent dehydrogenase